MNVPVHRKTVRIKGSSEEWATFIVMQTYAWLDDLLKNNVQGFLTVADLACNGLPAPDALTRDAIARGDLQPDGTIQTTRRDLARLMILDADDPMRIRLATWDELEVTDVA